MRRTETLIRTLVVWCYLLLSTLNVQAQKVPLFSFQLHDIPLDEALTIVKGPMRLRMHYEPAQVAAAKHVFLDIKKAPVDVVLYLLFKDQALCCRREDTSVYVRARKPKDTIRLKMLDEKGVPLVGATLQEVRYGFYFSTNEEGIAFIDRAPFPLLLECSHVSGMPVRIQLAGDTVITLPQKVALLEPVSMEYSSESLLRYSGNVDTSQVGQYRHYPFMQLPDLLRLPMPRVQALQVAGPAWAGLKFDMGNNFSIGNELGSRDNNAPLIVVNRVAIFQDYRLLNRVSSLIGDPANNGVPYNLLSAIPAHAIERIDYLKDAVSTAQYGARGANGVIVINTYKGDTAIAPLTFSLSTGWVTALRRLRVMDGHAYNQLRYQALASDGTPVDKFTAPDLVLLDTTKGIDWSRQLLGNHGFNRAAQLTWSREKARWGFSVTASHHKKSYVLPSTASDRWNSVQSGLHYASANQRFKASGLLLYSHGLNTGPAVNMFPAIFLIPSITDSLDASGKPTWKERGVAFRSPAGWMHNTNTTITNYWLGSLMLEYKLGKRLNLAMNAGGSQVTLRETGTFPLAGMAPNPIWTAYYEYSLRRRFNWILEPQLNWSKRVGVVRLNSYAGFSLQEQQGKEGWQKDSGYRSDLALAANRQRIGFNNPDSSFAYAFRSLFAGMNVLLGSQWSANLVWRQDRSSRLAATAAWKPFYAGGISWLFSQAPFMRKTASWLSYGKLRMSFGSTGSDQVNSDAGNDGKALPWALTEKWEGAVEAGLFKALDMRVGYYYYTSRNQFLELAELAAQTGAQPVVTNYGVKIRNQGWEWLVRYKGAWGKHLYANIGVTGAFPRNTLLRLPNHEPPFDRLVLGKALSARRVYAFAGEAINRGFAVKDLNKDGVITYAGDARAVKDQAVQYYANVYGSLAYKQFRIGFNIESRKQGLLNALWHAYYRQVPGNSVKTVMLNNQPASFTQWFNSPLRKRFTTQTLAGRDDILQYLSSDAVYTNSVYWLMKTIHFEYCLPGKWRHFLGLSQGAFYMQGENLFYFSRQNKDMNPLLQQAFGLPPVRTITAGVRFSPAF